MTDEKPAPKSRAKARKAPAVQSSVLAAALQDAMNGSFLNSGTDSTAALLAQMGGGNGSAGTTSGPPFKNAAPAVPAPAPEPTPEPVPEPEPVHAAAAPTAEETPLPAAPRVEAPQAPEAASQPAREPAPAPQQIAEPTPEPVPEPTPAATAPATPEPAAPAQARTHEPAHTPRSEPAAHTTPAPEPTPEPTPAPTPQPTRAQSEPQPPVAEPPPRAPEPVQAPATQPAKASTSAKPPAARSSRRSTPAPAPASPAPVATGSAEGQSAHASLLDSFLDARINSKGWETWGFRLLPDVKARLGKRLTADKRSSQNRRLALGHYLNAALLELPDDNDEQIEMIRSFLRARGGITDPSQSSSYRVSPAVYELARDLDTELTATEKRGLVVYLFSAAVELFLERLDAEGALGRPEIFSPQQ
ncbi:hypothetical protein ACFXMF_29320 [Embleya sp. NPDC059213]|uniref:hypothetical protein n=1 Tax=Embleya sp. NPDC059213 TaxID=3346771 RepID=UPI0036AA0354